MHLMEWRAIGIDTGGAKHVLGLAEGATENDGHGASHASYNLIGARSRSRTASALHRRLAPRRSRRRSGGPSGGSAALQRCQVHKGRNITATGWTRASMPASGRSCGRPWQQDDAAKAERLLRNLARRLEHDAPGCLGLDPGGPGRDPDRDPARPPAATSTLAGLHQRPSIATRSAPVRTVQRNVKRCPQRRDGAALDRRQGLLEAAKTFRRLKAYRQLPEP